MSNNNANKFKQPTQTKQFKKGLYEGEDEGTLGSDLEEELSALGLKYRFIDYKQAKANGNRSRNGWIIYTGPNGNSEPVRRGTTVLAVKTNDNHKKQTDRINLQRKAMNRYNANKEAELQGEARGISSRIIAGYNENG